MQYLVVFDTLGEVFEGQGSSRRYVGSYMQYMGCQLL